jgi:uncharacterized protein
VLQRIYGIAIRSERDEEKNETNLTKHGIDFETAREVFNDPHMADFIERFVVDSEERWLAFGSMEGSVILAVAYTTMSDGEGEVIRIVSARKADAKERRRYAN